MKNFGRFWQVILVAFVTFALLLPAILPASAQAGPAAFGTAQGGGGAKVSLDGGKTWLALTGRSMPVLDGTEIRSAVGSAVLNLDDGSRVRILPFSAVSFRDKAGASELSLAYGRLTFRMPRQTRLTVLTPSARLEPVRRRAMVGEVFASGTELMGIKMAQGALLARPLPEPDRVIVASLEPVFLPKRPSVPGPFFASDAPSAVPPGAKGVFTSSGESIGYLRPDGRLVISPGYTEDLTRPFSPKLVRMAEGVAPEQHKSDDAVPLFDVNGGLVGHLVGPIFYGHVPAANGTAGGGRRSGIAATAAAGAMAGIAGGGVTLGTVALNNGNKNGDDDDEDCKPQKATKMKPKKKHHKGCP